MQPEQTPAPAGHDDDNTAWLLTFSDLVLQLFAFIIVAVALGQRQVTATVVPPQTPPAAVAKAAPAVASGPAKRPTVVDVPLVVETAADDDALDAPAPQAAPVHEPVRQPIPEDDGPTDVAAAPASTPTGGTPPTALDAAYAQLRAFLARSGDGRAVDVAVRGAGLEVTLGESIAFASARAALLPTATPVLDEISALAETLPDYTVEIAGHTDDTPLRGTSATNLDLSLARAAAVARALVAHDPALRGRVVATGYGDTRPIASNADVAGRARNRRVELRFVPIDAAAR